MTLTFRNLTLQPEPILLFDIVGTLSKKIKMVKQAAGIYGASSPIFT